jgi:hypothetical protein
MVKFRIHDPKVVNFYDKIFDLVVDVRLEFRIEQLKKELRKYNCKFEYEDGEWWLCFDNEEDALAFILLN